MTPHKVLFRALQQVRYRRYLELLDPSAKTLLDLGCGDGGFVALARKKGLEARGTDIENDLSRTRESADIVTCFQVLEHVVDPPAALRNLAGLFHRQLIVSVPNEPWFSLWRMSWEREHLWAVTPAALRHHLGAPVFEERLFFRRYYLGIWKKS